MKRKVFRKLVSVEEAKRIFYAQFTPKPVGIESIPLTQAYGRVLAEDVQAQIDVPPFDRATMDGFAVHAEDTFGAEEEKPVILEIVGKVGAGERPEIDVEKGQAVETSTGAPIPKGANAVVMVEHTWQDGKTLRVFKPVSPGENIMAGGSDIMAGELILRKGTVLTPREIGVLASMGVTEVKVFRKPTVAIISTGNEIVQPGKPLEYGKIYDINSYSIYASVIENGGQPVLLGIVQDNAELITRKLREGLQKADMVITSGGTSAGVGDLLYQIIDNLGKPGILVHGVSVKPGKPLIIAVVDGKPLFGLPGYPTSALTIFQIFAMPVLREMAGLKPQLENVVIHAKTAEKIYLQEGRREYLPVNVILGETGEYTAYPILSGSGAITTLAEADGFIEIPENRTFLESGELVRVKLFSSELKPADLMIIGSHCVGIDILLELLRSENPNITSKVINVGSSGGLAAIRRGETDIAGIHLLDEETAEYNIPFLKRYGVNEKAVLVRGYNRQQGLIVAKGNPKDITQLQDIIRNDISFINRNPGSGTRILLDMNLKKIAKERKVSFNEIVAKINGYQFEAKSHTSVALAVLHEKADVGLGIKAVAERYGLDFIPIADEKYDFVIQKNRLQKQPIQAFLTILRSEKFKEELKKRAPGLVPTEETGKVIYPVLEHQIS
ncbi:MAG: molybdopterin biosynthesis protein [Candidatus Bathyarchaeia archaeon]